MRDYLSTPRRGIMVLLAACCVLGCASFNEARKSRVCWDGAFPGQCKSAGLDFMCEETIEVARTDLTNTPFAIELVRDVRNYTVGELFSQYCPPNCIPLYVNNGSPFRTLERDVRGIMYRAGYLLMDSEASDEVIKLNLVSADVRSEDPGWTSLTILTQAYVIFTVTINGSRRTFTGTADTRHAYAAIGDYQKVLSAAYCKSLSAFARAVEAGMLEAP